VGKHINQQNAEHKWPREKKKGKRSKGQCTSKKYREAEEVRQNIWIHEECLAN
jgi:hypothetical protein